jgi:predicted nucleic acid-binding protein
VIVVDASVVTHVLAVEPPDGPVHGRLGEQDELHAPEVIDLEVVSALRGLVVRRRLDSDAADRCIVDLLDLAIVRYAHGALLPRVWELRSNLSAYDASYVALAESLEAVLLTADAALARAPGVRCGVQTLPLS